MHIGLIGGIGPAATIAYYDRLTRRMRALDRPLELTIVQAEVADLVRNINAEDRAAQAAIYAPRIERLKAAGAECAAITSIGGHFCFAEIQARAVLPLVSAIEPLDAHFEAEGLRRVGLLGTGLVMRTRMYGQLVRTEAVTPVGDDLAAIGGVYQAIATSGTCTPAQRDAMVDAGRRMVEDQGADAIVLAGTDLNLAFAGIDPGYRVVDALDVHVEVLAQLAAGLRTLEA